MSLYYKLQNPKTDYYVPPRKATQSIKQILQEFQKYPIHSQASLQCFLDELFLESQDSYIIRPAEVRGQRKSAGKIFA